MKKKILIIGAVVLLGGGYVAKGTLMPPAKTHDKIAGTIYILSKQFTLNLRDGHFATLNVALELAPGQSAGASGEGAAAPPDGYGTLPEEAAIRDIVTNVVTDQSSADLIDPDRRERIKHTILLAIRNGTDVKVSSVLFTDVAVQ